MSPIFSKTKKVLEKKGFSLIETVLYITLLAVVMVVIVQMLVYVGGIYRHIKLERELEVSGTVALESMLREIRNATDVSSGQSMLEASPGWITLSGVDEGGVPYTVKFDVSSGALRIAKDSETPAAITSESVSVSYLLFDYVSSSHSKAVRVELEVSGNSGGINKTERFYGFAVLRGSY